MCTMSVYEARNNLSALIKTAESGEIVEITRHDKPVVVMLKKEDFEKMKPKKNFAEELMEWRKKWHIDEMPDDYMDEFIKNVESARSKEIPDMKKYDEMFG